MHEALMPKPLSPDIDEQFELLRTAVEALAADLNELTSGAGVTGAIKREERARLQWRTQQVLSLTKAIALDRTALDRQGPVAHRDESRQRKLAT
jgi:hypothetical protein